MADVSTHTPNLTVEARTREREPRSDEATTKLTEITGRLLVTMGVRAALANAFLELPGWKTARIELGENKTKMLELATILKEQRCTLLCVAIMNKTSAADRKEALRLVRSQRRARRGFMLEVREPSPPWWQELTKEDDIETNTACGSCYASNIKDLLRADFLQDWAEGRYSTKFLDYLVNCISSGAERPQDWRHTTDPIETVYGTCNVKRRRALQEVQSLGGLRAP